MWSLGVCLYIMLNDTIPFLSEDDQVMLQRQLTRDWKFRARHERSLSASVKELIGRMLEPDAGSRLTIHQLIDSWWMTSSHSEQTPLVSRGD